jgi:hypothetical protein
MKRKVQVMNEKTTLHNTWMGKSHGYPVRVEEHWNNLSYIIEFYDASEQGNGRCITRNPVTGEELTLENVQPETTSIAA